MKKFLTVLLIVIMVLQSGIVAMAGYKPMFSYSSWNGGRAIKSDLTLWDFEYKISSKRVNLEKIDDDVIFIEDNGTFRIKSDNSLWLYQTDYTKGPYPVKIEKKLMDDVESIHTAFATSQDYGYYVIKTDGSLWAWGSARAAVPGAKELFRDGERVDISHEDAVHISNDVTYVYGSSGMVFFVKKDNSLWAFGRGYIPYHEDIVELSKPTRLMENVRYIDSWSIIKSDDSLWSWGYGIYTGEEKINTDFMSVPVKIMDDVRSAPAKNVAIKNDNTLWAWGNLDGKGSGKYDWPIQPTQDRYYEPVLVGTGVLDFYAYSGNYILKTDGSLWGYGVAFENGVSEPVKIMQLMSLVIEGKNLVPTNEETVLTTTYYDKEGNPYADPGITWYCDDWSVAQVIPWGSNATIKGLKSGETVITAVHNASGEIASFNIRVEDYKLSLEDTYYFQKGSEEAFHYDITLAGKKVNYADVNVTWRVENTAGEVLQNLNFWNVDEYTKYIGFKCENNGECVLVTSINGNDVKRIPVKVLESLYELIEKQAILRAKVLSNNERYNYYKNTYVTAPWHIVNLIDTKAMKKNNTINKFFKKGFGMEACYEIVLWNLLKSEEYNLAIAGNKENVTGNVAEYFTKLGAERLDKAMEVSGNNDLKKLTSNCPVDFSGLLEGFMLAKDTMKDFENAYANLTTLVATSVDKIKTIETIMNSTGDKELKAACQNILDRYQAVLDSNHTAISVHLLNDGMESASAFVNEKVTQAILTGLGLGTIVAAAETTLELTNLVLNSDDVSEKAVVLIAYTEVETAMKAGLESAQKNFEANPCYDTAIAFTNLADSYKALLMDECDVTSEYIAAVETGDDSYSQIIWGDFTPDHSLRPFGASNDYKEFQSIVTEAKKVINNLDFYSADGVDIAAYISEVRSTEPSNWAVAEITEAIEKEILPEYMCFNYQEDITRAEFCTLLTNLMEKKTNKPIDELISEKGVLVKSPFEDTFYEYVDYMYKLGIVNGTGGNCFSPLEKITREEAATMLARAAKVLGNDTGSSAAVDDSVSEWAKAGVGYVTEKGIMKGTGNGFEPEGTYTKEQAVITFVRMFNGL